MKNYESSFMCKYDQEVCKRCEHSSPNGPLRTTCDYLADEKKRRPCRWFDCVRAGVWKPKKKVRPATIEKIMKKYGGERE